MKKILFSEVERTWLIDLLAMRLKYHESSTFNVNKHMKNLNSALIKLKDYEYNFSDWEKTMCISCVNEHLPSFYDQFQLYEELSLAIPLDILHEDHEKIDMGKDILVKCGYKGNVHFPRYNLTSRFRIKEK